MAIKLTEGRTDFDLEPPFKTNTAFLTVETSFLLKQNTIALLLRHGAFKHSNGIFMKVYL